MRRGRAVRIAVNGASVDACEGEPLAISLAAAGILVLRSSPIQGAPRAMFCLMGVCQECLVHVDGTPVEACLEPVRDGMNVTLDRLASERRAVRVGFSRQ